MASKTTAGKVTRPEITTTEAYMRTVNKISTDTRNWLIIMGAVQDLREAIRRELNNAYSYKSPEQEMKFKEFQSAINEVNRLIISETGSSIHRQMLIWEGAI